MFLVLHAGIGIVMMHVLVKQRKCVILHDIHELDVASIQNGYKKQYVVNALNIVGIL